MNYFSLKALNLNISAATLEKLETFATLLEKWNRVYNLTGAKNAREIFLHHILDSLSIAAYIRGPQVLDVGSGAGFPGIPLALAFPESHFVLLDSQSKKVRFLNQVVVELEIKNVTILQKRIEEFNSENCFNTIVTRATFTTQDLIAKSQHLLCADGQILLMKGKYPNEELAQIDKNYHVLIYKLDVPGLNAERHLCLIKKNP